MPAIGENNILMSLSQPGTQGFAETTNPKHLSSEHSTSASPRLSSPSEDNDSPAKKITELAAQENDGFIAFDFSDAEGDSEFEDDEIITNPVDSSAFSKDSNLDQTQSKPGFFSKLSTSLRIADRGKKRKREDTEDLLSEALWTDGRDYSQEAEVSVWLHKEILDFVDFVSPNSVDVQARAAAVGRIQKCVKGLWHDATVCVFGSYATNLYLPDSDIDLVIVSDSGNYCSKSNLFQLANALKAARIATNVEVIAKARVPIIKFKDRESGIQIDVSFEKYGGVVAADTILHWVAERPGLRELVMVIKYFLAVRDLNSVPNGGLGGFAVVCLVLSLFQVKWFLRSEFS